MGSQVVGQKLVGKNTKPRPEFDLYTTPVPVVERMLHELYHHVKANNVYEVLDPSIRQLRMSTRTGMSQTKTSYSASTQWWWRTSSLHQSISCSTLW